ncbi:MAG: hypothetical protein ACRC8A_01985 [Microcoleaceae cyanobacterium]
MGNGSAQVWKCCQLRQLNEFDRGKGGNGYKKAKSRLHPTTQRSMPVKLTFSNNGLNQALTLIELNAIGANPKLGLMDARTTVP